MAGHGENEHGHNEQGAMDISAHRASYDRFMGWAKMGTVICFVVAAIAVWLIAA